MALVGDPATLEALLTQGKERRDGLHDPGFRLFAGHRQGKDLLGPSEYPWHERTFDQVRSAHAASPPARSSRPAPASRAT